MLYLCWNNAKTCGRWKPFYKPGKKQQRLKPFHDIAKNKYYLATRLQKNSTSLEFPSKPNIHNSVFLLASSQGK